MELRRQHVDALRDGVERGLPLRGLIADALRDVEAGGGLWRFYSDAWPGAGVKDWNTRSPAMRAWLGLLPPGLWFFGEDVLGNQLCLQDGVAEAQLWTHEDGSLQTLEVDAVTLIASVCEAGVDWLDVYADGSLEVARGFLPVAGSQHLHWRTPLILGGAIERANLEPLERESHLAGHAALWRRVRDVPPGTEFVPR